MNYMRQSNTVQFEEDSFSKNSKGIAFIMHKAWFVMECLQTKLQVKSENIDWFGLYYTILKTFSDGGREN